MLAPATRAVYVTVTCCQFVVRSQTDLRTGAPCATDFFQAPSRIAADGAGLATRTQAEATYLAPSCVALTVLTRSLRLNVRAALELLRIATARWPSWPETTETVAPEIACHAAVPWWNSGSTTRLIGTDAAAGRPPSEGTSSAVVTEAANSATSASPKRPAGGRRRVKPPCLGW